jgi:hypothetical protein
MLDDDRKKYNLGGEGREQYVLGGISKAITKLAKKYKGRKDIHTPEFKTYMKEKLKKEYPNMSEKDLNAIMKDLNKTRGKARFDIEEMIDSSDMPKDMKVFKNKGGSILSDDMPMDMPMDTPMDMPQETEMVPDEAMEENYVDFVISQTLSEEEQEFLNEQLEGNDRLSVIFDQVIEAASEFTGDGPVEGPGTGVSDDIPARLSDGEFVFTAKAVEEIGEDVLMSMMKEAEASVDGRQELNEGGTAMLEQPEVDQFGKPVDADIVEDDIRKGMLSTNPRLR